MYHAWWFNGTFSDVADPWVTRADKPAVMVKKCSVHKVASSSCAAWPFTTMSTSSLLKLKLLVA